MSMASLPDLHENPQPKSKQYQLRVRVGDAEFFGSGPEPSVREDYSNWIEVIRDLGNAIASGNTMRQPAAEVQQEKKDPIESAWDRVFVRKEDTLSLNVLPQGKFRNADSIILLIYGYQKLLDLDGVKTTAIMEAAKQSGLRIDRVTRCLPKSHLQLIITGGSGKGSRYSLNNRGMNFAQDLLEKMFD